MSDSRTSPTSGEAGQVDARPRRRIERRSAVVLVVLFATAWIVFIFAGSLARAGDLEARLGEARARTAALEAQVDAGYDEIKFIQTEAFLGQAARGLGFGSPDEQAFALPDDAPPPPPVPIIGATSRDSVPAAPLEAWMELLFG